MTESVGGIQIQVRVTGLAAINDVIANLTGAGANLRPVIRDAATCRRDESPLRPHIKFPPANAMAALPWFLAKQCP